MEKKTKKAVMIVSIIAAIVIVIAVITVICLGVAPYPSDRVLFLDIHKKPDIHSDSSHNVDNWYYYDNFEFLERWDKKDSKTINHVISYRVEFNPDTHDLIWWKKLQTLDDLEADVLAYHKSKYPSIVCKKIELCETINGEFIGYNIMIDSLEPKPNIRYYLMGNWKPDWW